MGQTCYLITGGAGFIGQNLVEALARSGAISQIRVLDNRSAGPAAVWDQDGVEFVLGDLCDQETATRAVTGVDCVVHLGAFTGVVPSVSQPLECVQTNVVGTVQLLWAAARAGVRGFVMASTAGAIAGNQPPPISEGIFPRPLSPYGASKAAAEAFLSAFTASYGLPTVALRLANVYGPHSDHKSSVVTQFLRWAQTYQPLVIYGDGRQTRDFIHVSDVCHAISLCLSPSKLSDVSGEVFQIASGVETSVQALAEMVMGVTGRQLRIDYQPERKGEIRRNYSDIAKAKARLGFQPRVSLRDGIADLWRRVQGERG